MSKHQGFSGDSVVKNPPADSEDIGLIPELGRSAGGGNGYPPQYSCLENPMDTEAWWATVHKVAESDMTEHCTPPSFRVQKCEGFKPQTLAFSMAVPDPFTELDAYSAQW